MHITIMAFGSRGDVQPYLALALGLKRAGHTVRMVGMDDYAEFAAGYGIDYFSLGIRMFGSLESDILFDAIESGRNVWGGINKLLQSLKPMVQQLMERAWEACQGTDAILFSSIGITGYHAAEKLKVPAVWALTFPMLARTRAIPSPLLPLKLGKAGNWLTHAITEQIWRQIIGRFENHWRQRYLDLPPIPLYKWPYKTLHGRPLPKLYHFSPHVFPKPPDWDEHIHVTGYWFLDTPPDWQPPADLLAFLEDGPPPVYVGFGSMPNRDPGTATALVVEALRRAEKRGIVLTYQDSFDASSLPDTVFAVESVPHDWLFPRMAAVVHHGGAGTTAAGLRAGVPTVVIPTAGDQPLWAERIEALGVGPAHTMRKALTAEKLAYAIRIAATHAPMRARAAALGEKIRAEDGIGHAVQILERYIHEDKPVSPKV